MLLACRFAFWVKMFVALFMSTCCSHLIPFLSTVFCLLLHLSRSTEKKISNPKIILDRTLPRRRDIQCPKCFNMDAVYYQPQNDSMALLAVCCNPNCVHTFTMNEESKDDERKAAAN